MKMAAAIGPKRGLVRAAALIATFTVLARVAGFVRTAVFARTVGSGCVGVVYQTANTIPNILFDIVAGGTLSALIVPLLAPALAGDERATASRIVSALLTWSVLILGAITIMVVVFAAPISRALLGEHQCAGANALGARMLVVFAPQILFYGIGVVLGGSLQAARRFAWPALAPLLSSVVVVVVYLTYSQLARSDQLADGLPRSAELVLSVGTTAGVIVLAACQIPAATKLGLRIRPTFRFPVGLAPLVRRAALAGGVTLGSQQIATAVMLRLANGGIPGTLVVLTIAQAVYLLPWAVLAVPVATAVFPGLSSSWDAGERARVAELTVLSARVVSALAALGTAALVAAATPIANVLLDHRKDAHTVFGPAIAAFAVGLLGWSLVALLARVLYAARSAHLAAAGQAVGWLLTIVVDVIVVQHVSSHDRAVVLALGNAAGVTVAAGLLVFSAWRIHALDRLGVVALSCGRAGLAAALGALVGWRISRLAAGTGVFSSVMDGLAAAVAGVLVAAIVLLIADHELIVTLRRPRSLTYPGDVA
jgi:putative peptidoglycan lipid II flippase